MDQADLFGLQGAHVIITGASGGIGLATVDLFHTLGARITAHTNTNTTSLQELKTRKCIGDDIHILTANATNEEDIIAFYHAAMEKDGPPQVLVGTIVDLTPLVTDVSLSWDFRNQREGYD